MKWPLSKINKWKAYFDLQPFGFFRDEYLTAQVCSTIYTASGNVKRPPELKDLMYYTNALTKRFGSWRKLVTQKMRKITG